MAALLSLVVRTVHVLGMVALLGGSAFTWHALGRDAPESAPARRTPAQYEWLFWGTMGAMLVTGVGNLGALGAPGPSTRWGTVLTVKLALVTVFVLGSVVRTLVICRLRERGSVDAASDSLRRAYGATAIVLVVLVALAEVLAHG